MVGMAGMAAALPAAAQVSGVVLDGPTRLPVAGARVTLQATATEVTTDADGTFRLAVDDGARVKVVAGRVGYFNAGADVVAPRVGMELALDPVPVGDNAAYAFLRPDTCGNCHTRQAPAWRDSAMAHAGTNRWVYDLYDGSGTDGGAGGFVYTRDSIHAGTNPASECRACHQPVAWLKNPYTPLSPLSAADGDVAMGVACDVCHKVARVDETRPNFPGMWPGVVEVTRPYDGWNVEYGALGDVTYRQEGLMRASYQPQLPAALCATCHQDKNDPDGDGDFEEDDGVVSEPTYLEWKESPYGDPDSPLHATCADCHMPALPDRQACGVLGPVLFRPLGDVTDHRLEGTSARYLDHAVSLALQARLLDGRIVATVTLVNDRAGHRVPTGVTMRNVVLVVEAWRTPGSAPLAFLGGPTVHALGGLGDPARGDYAGMPGRLYAKVARDEAGNAPVFFTEATAIVDDNRLAPLQADVTAYEFQAPAGGGNIHVRARVIYRRAWRALVLQKGWTQTGHGSPLEDVAAPHFGHLMASAEVLVEVPVFCDAGSCPGCRGDEDCGAGWRCSAGTCTPAPPLDGGAASSGGGSSASSAAGSSSPAPTASSASSAPEPTVPPPRAGCAATRVGRGAPWWLVGVSALAWRRRRAFCGSGARCRGA